MKAAQEKPINLHGIPALNEIQVRDDLKLRLAKVSDAKRVIEILNADPSIRDRVTVASKFHTESDVINEIIEHQYSPDILRYALLHGDDLVGWVNLWQDNGYISGKPDPSVIGFGYFLDPVARGKGLITDAIKRLMVLAQENMKVTGFVAYCEDDNEGSVKILKKLGFTPTEDTHKEPKNGWVERMWVRKV